MFFAIHSNNCLNISGNQATPWGSMMSLYSASVANMTPTNENVQFGSPFSAFGAFPRNLYRLLAVIVHGGEGANNGHFITYRRGSLRNYHKWYLTSDHMVREVSIEEVLQSPAYMLFYDRSHNRN
jgi:ubiquitin carboxyl-terminal hydrolase 30